MIKGRIIVDTKETVWYRQYFDVEKEMTVEEFLKEVESGKIESYNGNYIDDSTEQLTPEDNNSQPTLEIYQDYNHPDNLIYANA